MNCIFSFRDSFAPTALHFMPSCQAARGWGFFSFQEHKR